MLVHLLHQLASSQVKYTLASLKEEPMAEEAEVLGYTACGSLTQAGSISSSDTPGPPWLWLPDREG